jgi:hypothetical protein
MLRAAAEGGRRIDQNSSLAIVVIISDAESLKIEHRSRAGEKSSGRSREEVVEQ